MCASTSSSSSDSVISSGFHRTFVAFLIYVLAFLLYEIAAFAAAGASSSSSISTSSGFVFSARAANCGGGVVASSRCSTIPPSPRIDSAGARRTTRRDAECGGGPSWAKSRARPY